MQQKFSKKIVALVILLNTVLYRSCFVYVSPCWQQTGGTDRCLVRVHDRGAMVAVGHHEGKGKARRGIKCK